MTGIIHFDRLSRVEQRVSRRTLLAGGAGVAISAALGIRTTMAQTPDASPVPARGGTYMADARDRLRTALSWLPTEFIANRRDALELFAWTDFQTHFGALGITDPYASDDLVPATLPVPSLDPLYQYSAIEEIHDELGFRLFDVHQVLSAGVPANRLAIYAGGVTFSDLSATWEATGYQRKSADWGDYWTLGENGEIDLQRGAPLGLGSMNNIALLADDVAVFAQTLELLSAVMAREEGGKTAAEDEGIDMLVESMPIDTVLAFAFPGEVFRADSFVPENPGMDSFTTAEELLAESDAAVGPMPRLLLSLCGVTAGAMSPELSQDGGTPTPRGNEDAHAFLSFLTTTEEQAATAAEVAYWRLENMQSPTTGVVYSERFLPAQPVEEAAEGQVMTVTFDQSVASTGAWMNLILSRDSWPFAWIGAI